MKRKFLEDLGLEKEVIDKIMTENGNDINTAKSEYDTLKSKLEKTIEQLKEKDVKIESLTKMTGDSEELKKQINLLQKENQKNKEQYESEMKNLQISSAIKIAVGDNAQDTELVASLFDKSKLLLAEDGTVTGLEEQLKTLKETKSFLFKDETQQTTIKGANPAESRQGLPSTKKTSEMTYSELCSYIEANPGAKII